MRFCLDHLFRQFQFNHLNCNCLNWRSWQSCTKFNSLVRWLRTKNVPKCPQSTQRRARKQFLKAVYAYKKSVVFWDFLGFIRVCLSKNVKATDRSSYTVCVPTKFSYLNCLSTKELQKCGKWRYIFLIFTIGSDLCVLTLTK